MFAKSNSPQNVGIATRLFIKCLHEANDAVEEALRQRWVDAGLNQVGTLDELEKQLGGDSE